MKLQHQDKELRTVTVEPPHADLSASNGVDVRLSSVEALGFMGHSAELSRGPKFPARARLEI